LRAKKVQVIQNCIRMFLGKLLLVRKKAEFRVMSEAASLIQRVYRARKGTFSYAIWVAKRAEQMREQSLRNRLPIMILKLYLPFRERKEEMKRRVRSCVRVQSIVRGFLSRIRTRRMVHLMARRLQGLWIRRKNKVHGVVVLAYLAACSLEAAQENDGSERKEDEDEEDEEGEVGVSPYRGSEYCLSLWKMAIWGFLPPIADVGNIHRFSMQSVNQIGRVEDLGKWRYTSPGFNQSSPLFTRMLVQPVIFSGSFDNTLGESMPSFDGADCVLLATLLSHPANQARAVLLANCDLSSERTIHHFCQGVSRNLSISTLALVNANLSFNSVLEVIDIYTTKNFKLKELILDGFACPHSKNEQILLSNAVGKLVSDYFSTRMGRLIILSLHDCNLGSEFANHMSPHLKDASILKQLVLSGNNLGHDGGTCILQGIIENDSLEVLDLCENRITCGEWCDEESLPHTLQSLLQSNSTLKMLSLKNNLITSSILSHVIRGMGDNCHMEILDLRENPILVTSTHTLPLYRVLVDLLEENEVGGEEAGEMEDLTQSLVSTRQLSKMADRRVKEDELEVLRRTGRLYVPEKKYKSQMMGSRPPVSKDSSLIK